MVIERQPDNNRRPRGYHHGGRGGDNRGRGQGYVPKGAPQNARGHGSGGRGRGRGGGTGGDRHMRGRSRPTNENTSAGAPQNGGEKSAAAPAVASK